MSDIPQLLREVLQHGDEQGVRFPLGRHVPDSLISHLAEETYRYAASQAEHRGNEDPSWLTYPDGILGWWTNQGGLNDKERHRLHKFRSDVVRHLEALGLARREKPRSTLLLVRAVDADGEAPSNPDWARDEIVLALDLFVRAGSLGGNPLPGKKDLRVIALSERMAVLPIHPRQQRGQDFRNPTSIALKLANFRAVERDTAIEQGDSGAENLPKGMRSYSALDRGVFEEFSGEWDRLHNEAAAIVSEGSAAPENNASRSAVASRPVEDGRVETFDAAPTEGGTRTRREVRLVQRYKNWMAERGHLVVGREYRITGEARPLRCDAFVEGLRLLIEAKAQDNRNSIRLAIGQLMDYRRFEDRGSAVRRHSGGRSGMMLLVSGLEPAGNAGFL